MTARDELVNVLDLALANECDTWAAWLGGAADEMLANGWRQLRTINTTEELHALPEGTVLRCDWATHQKILGKWATFGGPGTTVPELPGVALLFRDA